MSVLLLLSNSRAFSPLSVANLSAWYDASDASTITLNGSNVSQWRDKSGNNNHATQGTAANQPAYNSNQINSKATLTFDATNDSMTLATPLVAAGSTCFVVANFNGPTDAGPFLANNTTADDLYFGVYNGGTMYLYETFTVNSCIGATARNSTASIYYFTSAAGSNAIFRDAATISSARPGTLAQSFTKLGNRAASEWMSGNIGEVLYYNRILTAGEIAQVKAYLKAKWATP